MSAMSTLRIYSERHQIPFHHFTRGISAAIFVAYAYKYACPIAADCINNFRQQAGNLQRGFSACGKGTNEDQQQLIEQLFAKKSVSGDILNGDKHSGDKQNVNDAEDYTDFGLPNEGIVGRAVELCVQLLRWLQRVTGIKLSFPLQMLQLLRIMVPSIWGPEAMLVVLHTCTLIARTFLSIYVAKLEGSVVKFIVRRDPVNFGAQLTRWLLIALPCSFTNSLIRFLESQLALAFRSRLVSHAYEMYFRNRTYYSASNLDTRLENADHSLTDDLSYFAAHCAHLYSSVTKPLLDLSLISYTLYNMASGMGASGRQGPLLGALAILSTHAILRLVSPSFGRLVAEEARRRGFLRFVHSRIIGHAEEIGFYGGENIEQSLVQVAYDGLAQQMNRIYNQRLWYIMLEQFLMKYVWSATGMVMVAIPVMAGQITLPGSTQGGGDSREDVSERTQYMTTAKNILIAGGDAAERLMSSYKELIELTGYTRRVSKMFTVFDQVSRGKYVRSGQLQQKLRKSPALMLGSDGAPVLRGVLREVPDFIRLTNVPVVTPNLDTVIESISLTIPRHMHLLITGPNGCGKSSLFRLLSSLWPIHTGTVERPPKNQLFYIPQRPYMSLGTLRDQLIYPHTVKEMKEHHVSDHDLEEILDLVHLKHIVRREGGWDARGDWREMLSGGEKQRMALGRLFYHKPMFALLDECTSAVSMDVECKLYQAAKNMGITLITITHRPSLWKYHTHLLQFDGEGGYRLERLDTDIRLSLREEKEKLQAQLAGVPVMTMRLKELCAILGEDSILIEEDVITDSQESSLDSI